MKKLTLFIILTILGSNILNAQCDCASVTITTTTGNTVEFTCQVLNYNINCPPSPCWETHTFKDIYQYDMTTYTCGSTSVSTIVPSSFVRIASYASYSNGAPLVLQPTGPLGGDCYNGNSDAGFQAWFEANTSNFNPCLGSYTFDIDADCYTLVDVIWPPTAFCNGQVIGELPNGGGPIIGTAYPPNRMYIPCFSNGCCEETVVCGATSGSISPGSASCGTIDLSKVKWTSPCGTFFGTPTATIEPCTPKCGEGYNVNKMAAVNSRSPVHLKFSKNAESKDANMIFYQIYLKNDGNTLQISTLQGVKQINILDLNGRKTTEIKSPMTSEIDFSKYGNGIYLVQIVKMDNTELPAQKIVK